MKSKIIIAFLLLAAGLNLRAQSIVTGQAHRFSIRSDKLEVLGQYRGLLYIHEYDKADHFISTLNDRLGVVWKKRMPYNYRGQDPLKVVLQQGNICFFYAGRRKSSRIIYMARFDTLMKMDTIIFIDSIRKNFGEGFPKIHFLRSDNHQFTVLYYLKERFNEPDELIYTRLNNDFEVMVHDTLRLPTAQKKRYFYDLILSDDGRMFVVVNRYYDNTLTNSDQFTILTSERNFSVSPGLTILQKERVLNNALFRFDNRNNQLVMVAFYTTDPRKGKTAEGVYFWRYHFADSTAEESFIPFTPDFIAKIVGTSNQRVTDRLYYFMIDKVIVRQDGGVVFVAESYHKTVRPRNNGLFFYPYGTNDVGEVSTTYYFEDILVMSIHPDGTEHWRNILAKQQISSGDNGRHSSYMVANLGSHLAFIFNDELKYRTNVIEYLVNVNGNVERHLLMNSKKRDVYLMPIFGDQVSGRDVIIPSYKRGKLRFVKLSY